MKLKKLFIAAVCLLLTLCLLAGCADQPTDASASPSENPTATDGTTSAATDAPTSTATSEPGETVTPSPSPTQTVVPDPSKVTLMIEDFNNITNVQKALDPMDLSIYDIIAPEYSFEAEFAQEGVAFVNTLDASSWCQAFQIIGSRLDVFKEAKSEHYIRMWVVTPDDTSVGITIEINDGSRRSFIDATKAIVTGKDGKTVSCSTGNDSGDAGNNSSIRIPEGFAGYVAFPLSALKAWNNSSALSDLSAVSYLKLDIRPAVATSGDRYALDALCITDSAYAETVQSSGGNNDDQKPDFNSKNEELDYMIAQALKKEASFQYCPEYDPVGYPNIKAIWIDGVNLGTKATKVFAYIGFPTGASKDKKVPAVVLQHGGGGYAYPNWVKMWNDKGYAAIAIGNTGYYPAKEGITDYYNPSSWTRNLTREMREKDPRLLPPDNDGMGSSTGAVNRMWMYHAVAQTAIANSLLRADERVNPDQIGITGISWGGVITSIAIGYDARFAFAVPVYGSGYLYEALSWMKNNFNSAGTKELWDASLKLKTVKMPVLWLCWTNDNCFSINSNDKSFADTENGVLSMIMNMGHGHAQGWDQPEIYKFADSVVKNGQPLTTCATQPQAANKISFTINKPSDAASVTARVCYIKEKMTYSPNGLLHIQGQDTIDQEWQFVNCTVDGNKISATIPSDAYSYYVEITTQVASTKYVTTSRFIDIKK